jgi:hypothetical protein
MFGRPAIRKKATSSQFFLHDAAYEQYNGLLLSDPGYQPENAYKNRLLAAKGRFAM